MEFPAPCLLCGCSSRSSQASQLWLGQREASKEKQEAAQLNPRPHTVEIGVPSSLQHVAVTSVSLNVITSLKNADIEELAEDVSRMNKFLHGQIEKGLDMLMWVVLSQNT